MINEDYVLETFKEGDITLDVKVDYNNKTIWLSQNDMAILFSTTKQNISRYIKNYFLPISNLENAKLTVKNLLTVQNEGSKKTNREIKHYNLDVILTVGYKCNSEITMFFKNWVENLFDDYVQVKNEGKLLNEAKSYEIMQFRDGEFCLDVNVSPQENTIWLDAEEIGLIFERDYKTILKHINNIFAENEVEQASNSQKMRLTGNSKPTIYYNFNVIIADEYVYLLDNSFNNIDKVKMVITKLEDIKKEYILKDLKY